MTGLRHVRQILAIVALLSATVAAQAAGKQQSESPDTITAQTAFCDSKAKGLQLLPVTVRRDMVEYMRIDSIYRAPNALEGISWLERPFSPEFLRVRVTPVSTVTYRILQGKKGDVVAELYTIGGGSQAADSEITFYDPAMRELKRDRIFRPARVEDFIRKETPSSERKKIIAAVPFPTVVYQLSPDSETLTVRLTVKQYMGEEEYAAVSPHLLDSLRYRWTGSKYERVE